MIHRLVLVLFVTTSSIYALGASPKTGLGINGGRDADIQDYPFTVSLVAEYPTDDGDNYIDFRCGGTLIAPSWVLTASYYCFRSYDTNYSVYAGAAAQFEGERYPVEEIIVHENYTNVDGKLENDLVLLKLASPVTCEFCQPISISPTGPNVDEDVIILGWGGAQLYLQYLHILVMDEDFCYNHTHIEQSDHVFCAGRNIRDNISSCDVDRGGPIIYDLANTLVGVISCPPKSRSPPSPLWYTNIVDYTDWINEHINQ